LQTDKIALIAPNKDFTLRALDLFSEWGEKIHVAMASKDDVIGIVQQLADRGADGLICYACFDETIKATVNIPTVPIKPSVLDVLQGIEQVKTWLLRQDPTITADDLVVGLTAETIVPDVLAVAAILGLKIKIIPDLSKKNLAGITAVIKEAAMIAAGQHDAQPEYCSCGIPCFTIATGPETLLKSVQQVRQLLLANRGGKVKLEQLKAVMEFTGDGIIAVDNQRRIFYINHAAKKLLRKSEEQLSGQLAAAIFPEIDLEDAIRYGQIRNTVITDGGEQNFTCRVVPMILGGQSVGAVLTISESTMSHKEKVGKAQGEKGHRASYTFDDFITVNAAMKETLETAKSYASVDSPILIRGDTGTGKEIIAQSIHNYSRRCQGPFVAVNCAALPESLLESELFGYEYGAFTGARKNGKKGLFEQADKGTIFLDEIGEISLGMQARLLRVIQQREIMRIGSDKVIAVDVGIIAATHRNLPELIEKGEFRRDLYHRLNVLKLKLLPLSARKEDLPYLVECISDKLAAKLLKPRVWFSAGAMSMLTGYNWPGNVRELEGIIERLLILKKDNIVSAEDIEKVLECESGQPGSAGRMVPIGTMEEIERAVIIQVLHETGNQDQTARILGISTTTIWRKLKTLQNERFHCKMNE
jgi:transcriptional regulator with PAS, ATPase and Fis domain